jgi:hypothetical protein
MSAPNKTAPDDFTMFYAVGGGIAAFIAGGLLISNYGWLVFAWVAGTALMMAWGIAVIVLLVQVRNRLPKP